MRLQWHFTFWIGLVVLLVAALYLLGGVLTPFIMGFALAYLLDPIAGRLERLGLNRHGAALVMLGLFILAVVAAVFLLVPILVRQLSDFVQSLPDIIDRLTTLATEQGDAFIKSIGGGLLDKFGVTPDVATSDIDKYIASLVGQSGTWLTSFLGSVVSSGHALIGTLSLIVVAPVVAFYILLDWERMIAAIDSWIPLDQRADIRMLAAQIDSAIAGFLRGQSLVCLFLGIWYSVTLSLIGLNYGLLIGISAGFLSFIPYVGSLSALVVAAGVAIVQGWPSLSLLVEAVGFVSVGQFLEGNVLSPRLVGASVGVHPVWLMFALFAFGALFGFTGLMVAVPVTAAGGVLMRYGLKRYLDSSLYRGRSFDVPEELPSASTIPSPVAHPLGRHRR